VSGKLLNNEIITNKERFFEIIRICSVIIVGETEAGCYMGLIVKKLITQSI